MLQLPFLACTLLCIGECNFPLYNITPPSLLLQQPHPKPFAALTSPGHFPLNRRQASQSHPTHFFLRLRLSALPARYVRARAAQAERPTPMSPRAFRSLTARGGPASSTNISRFPPNRPPRAGAAEAAKPPGFVGVGRPPLSGLRAARGRLRVVTAGAKGRDGPERWARSGSVSGIQLGPARSGPREAEEFSRRSLAEFLGLLFRDLK